MAGLVLKLRSKSHVSTRARAARPPAAPLARSCGCGAPRRAPVTAMLAEDEMHLFAGAEDGAVYMWRMNQEQQSFDEVAALDGHDKAVVSLRRRQHPGLGPRDPPVHLQPRRPLVGGHRITTPRLG
uniref:Uncharacterized protein n=1 Tax=Oryza brachyantha TaxID=4533 RepID=J3LXH2_ORYBR